MTRNLESLTGSAGQIGKCQAVPTTGVGEEIAWLYSFLGSPESHAVQTHWWWTGRLTGCLVEEESGGGPRLGFLNPGEDKVTLGHTLGFLSSGFLREDGKARKSKPLSIV